MSQSKENIKDVKFDLSLIRELCTATYSKYFEIMNQVALRPLMNHVCAAGTGTFGEEQALKLLPEEKDNKKRIDLFDALALQSVHVYTVHGRCTTFMKKECDYASRSGVATDDICAGIAEGIARNYSNEFKPLERLVDSMKLAIIANPLTIFPT